MRPTISTTHDSGGPAPAPGNELDRRRDKRQTAMRKAATKMAEAAAADSQLAASQERLRQQEQALRAARTQAAMLKKTIKRVRKRNTELTDRRKSAHREATRAQERAEKADAKYERAVLDEILRREKRADLATSNFGGSDRPSLPTGKNSATAALT